jgi:hypothetical protein
MTEDKSKVSKKLVAVKAVADQAFYQPGQFNAQKDSLTEMVAIISNLEQYATV